MRKRGSYGTVLVQSCGNHEEAEATVSSLIEAGFTPAQVSVVLGEGQALGGGCSQRDRWSGAVVDALRHEGEVEAPGLGLVLGGPLVRLLDGRSFKNNGPQLERALLELGVEKEEAGHYRKRSQAGEIIVVAAAE